MNKLFAKYVSLRLLFAWFSLDKQWKVFTHVKNRIKITVFLVWNMSTQLDQNPFNFAIFGIQEINISFIRKTHKKIVLGNIGTTRNKIVRDKKIMELKKNSYRIKQHVFFQSTAISFRNVSYLLQLRFWRYILLFYFRFKGFFHIVLTSQVQVKLSETNSLFYSFAFFGFLEITRRNAIILRSIILYLTFIS